MKLTEGNHYCQTLHLHCWQTPGRLIHSSVWILSFSHNFSFHLPHSFVISCLLTLILFSLSSHSYHSLLLSFLLSYLLFPPFSASLLSFHRLTSARMLFSVTFIMPYITGRLIGARHYSASSVSVVKLWPVAAVCPSVALSQSTMDRPLFYPDAASIPRYRSYLYRASSILLYARSDYTFCPH